MGMMDEFENFDKLYDKDYRGEVVLYITQKMQQDELYYLCEYAEDGAVAFELRGDKIYRHISIGVDESDVRGIVHKNEEKLSHRNFIIDSIVKVAEMHGGVRIMTDTDFERLWDQVNHGDENKCFNKSFLERAKRWTGSRDSSLIRV